ncbi:MAG: precorrin-6A reductase [Candidatus Methanomethylophilaceae archaeon]
MKDVFIFSGTTEGRTLARWLASRGVMVHVRVATEYGAEVMERDDNIDVKVGSCGGSDGIAQVIRESMYELVVDATHPYATTVSKHIREGCEKAGAEYIRLKRSAAEVDIDSDVITVDSVQDAVDYLKTTEGKILAATGSNDIDLYTQIPDYKERVTARVLSTVSSITRCSQYGFEGRNLICAQGPFSEETNYATLRDIGASYMVTKDSGTVGGFEEKVRAARRAGVRIVLVRKPDDTGLEYDDVVRLLEDRLGLEHTEDIPEPQGRRSITLIGIGVGGEGLTISAARRIADADIVIGARRMLDSVDTRGKDTYCGYMPDDVLGYLGKNQQYRRAAILMSGDVGFYSGAKKLLSAINREVYDVDVESGISSLVYLCSKAETSWDDAYLTSAHGRDANIIGICSTHRKVFTLLSGEESVQTMCRQLFDYSMDVTVTVGQDFGMPSEKIFTGTPSELLDQEFGSLCVALIVNEHADDTYPLSIPDEDFVRGDAPMTKSEVRALSVAKLKLRPDSIVYDVGAGTGSVSVEMALAAFRGKVYAVEKEDDAANLIEINKKKFKTPNIEVIQGLAPEALDDLPAPTHAFIGGSSGNLKQIIQCILAKNPQTRIVINSVTIETMSETFQVIKELNLIEEDITNINVSRARHLGRYHLMTAQNPVYIAVVRGR